MGVAIALASMAAATYLLADQHRSKVEQGGSGWWDWHSRDPDGHSMAKTTVWSHDSWVFILGVAVPVAVGISKLGRRAVG